MKTNSELSLIFKMDDICNMYGNNEERIIAAAAELGCRTDSWYVAAQHIATYEETPNYLKPLIGEVQSSAGNQVENSHRILN